MGRAPPGRGQQWQVHTRWSSQELHLSWYPGSLWFLEGKVHFPMRARSVPLSSGSTNSLLGGPRLPAVTSTPPRGKLYFPPRVTQPSPRGWTPALIQWSRCGTRQAKKQSLCSPLHLEPSAPRGSKSYKVLAEPARNIQLVMPAQNYWIMICIFMSPSRSMAKLTLN